MTLRRAVPAALALAAVLGCGQDRVPADAPSLSLVPLATIGAEDGPSDVFGEVTDVAAGAGNRLYVLDAQASAVSVYTREGRFLQRLGREGAGPGELRDPLALAVDARERLYVLDPGNARLERFEGADGRMRHTGTIALDFGAADVCAAGERLYVLGAREGALVHEYDAAGRRLRSFGTPPGEGDPLLAATLSSGYLACEGDGVVFLPLLSPEVRRLAPDGAARGTEIPAYRAVRISRGGGGLTLSAPDGGTHEMASTVAALAPGSLLVQVGELRPGPRGREDVTRLRSWLLGEGGRLTPAARDFPRIVAARDGLAFGVEQDPYPRVTVYRVNAGGGGAP